MDRIRETFNAGPPLQLLKQTTIRNEARVQIGTEDKIVAKLHFNKMMMRDADSYALGDELASKVSRKVKTMFHPIIKNELKNKYFIKINNDKYNIIYTDYDDYYCFFYLERIGSNGSEGAAREIE
ncbi:hypothetical protein LABALGNA3A7_09750 [Dellaglioa algida]|nr:hypothetical protein LABALGNA3A7_09750 [Dellaglioa algida]